MRKKNLLIKNRNNKKKILFLVNSIDFFISHRLPIARRCIQEDYSVIVAAPKNKEFIKNQTKYNFQLIDFDIKNGEILAYSMTKDRYQPLAKQIIE